MYMQHAINSATKKQTARPYYSELEAHQKEGTLEGWLEDAFDVVCATKGRWLLLNSTGP
jgi:superfamily II DNA helicase RecQ